MANTFDFVGKIMPCKETENFKPYEKHPFNSGWVKTTLRFNIICDSNRHLLDIGVFTPSDIENATIYTTKQGKVKEDGTRGNYENIQVSYEDRNKPEIIESVAAFKKFVVDTELPKRRKALETALENFTDGTITDEQINELGINTFEECQAEFEKSKKRRHEFIWEYDFIEYLNKLVNNASIKDYKWHIMGSYELEYSEQNDQWYRKFKPQRIYRALDTDTAKSQGDFVIVFGKDAVDDSDYAETKKLHINGFIGQYLGKPYKKTCYAPLTFTVDGNGDEKAEKMAQGFKKKFTFPDECECDYREIGVVCNILDGAQQVELTEDMLTDEQKENIEFGLTTLEEIKKELGKPVFGDKVTDIVITGLARGYSNGAKDTVYTAEDMGKPMADFVEIESTEKVFDDVDDDDDDII
jgi:hypothetical protein